MARSDDRFTTGRIYDCIRFDQCDDRDSLADIREESIYGC